MRQKAATRPMRSDSANKALPPVALTDYAGYLLNSVADRIRGQTAEALTVIGVTPRQAGILTTIAEQGPLTQHELGERRGIDRTSVVALIDDLEARGWVARSTHPEDRRAYALSLTPAGEETLAHAARLIGEAQARFLQPLDESEWNQLRSLLLRLLSH